MHHMFRLRACLHNHFMADASGNTAFTECLLQRDFRSEARTVHRKHVCRRWPQLVSQEVNGGRDAFDKVAAGEVQPTNDLSKETTPASERTSIIETGNSPCKLGERTYRRRP